MPAAASEWHTVSSLPPFGAAPIAAAARDAGSSTSPTKSSSVRDEDEDAAATPPAPAVRAAFQPRPPRPQVRVARHSFRPGAGLSTDIRIECSAFPL